MPAHLLDGESRPEESLDIAKREVDLDRMDLHGDLIDHGLEHLAAAELDHHRRCPSHWPVR